MPNIIGIDLGTSTTLMAVLSNSGEAILSKNSSGDLLTHSAVWFEGDDRIVIGTEAKKMLGVVPDGQIFVEFKRDMGDENIVHEINGKRWRPRNFSALVLKQIKEYYESNNGTIDAAIITIPANFSDQQRVDTIEAAKEAGFILGNDALVNEPTAAAVYYASTSPSQLKGKYLIYDFGGGTFDATILEVNGDAINVLTSMGVQRLGGKDLDRKLIEIIANKFSKLTGSESDPDETLKEVQLTKHDVEQLKHTLSVRDKVSVPLRSTAHGMLRTEVTRNEFEASISTLITQAELAVDTALESAGLKPFDLAGVFLAGGSTLVPAVSQSIERHLGIKAISRDPVGSVALGACLYAAIRNKSKLNPGQSGVISKKKVQDVTPHFFGTTYVERETKRFRVKTIIPKDQPLPCKKTELFVRGPENSSTIQIRVTQSPQDQTDPDLVEFIWEGAFEDLPPVATDSEMRVTYEYDVNGVMNCSVLDAATGRTLDSKIDKAKLKASGNKTDGVDIDDFIIE